MKRITGIISVLLCAIIACTAPDLYAQFPGGGRPGAGGGRPFGGPPGGATQGPRPAADGNVVELIDFRLGLLEEDLKLANPQLKAWETCAERVRALAADIARERAPSQALAPPTAMQQMTRAVDIARNRLTALEEIAGAAQRLYDVLTPDQKMLADSRFPTILPLLAGIASQGSALDAGERPGAQDGGFGGLPRGGERRGRQ